MMSLRARSILYGGKMMSPQARSDPYGGSEHPQFNDPNRVTWAEEDEGLFAKEKKEQLRSCVCLFAFLYSFLLFAYE